MTQPQTIKNPSASPTAHSWSWLRACSRELYDLDEIPLFGSTPPFPWEQLANELSLTCGLKNFELQPGQIEWKDFKNFVDGIKPPYYTSAFQASGVEGVGFFVLHQGDLELLMRSILKMEGTEIEALPSEFLDSFHTFIELQAISLINQLGFDKKVSIKEVHAQMENLDGVLCQEIWISCDEKKVQGFLLLPANFQKSWKMLFAKLPKREISPDRLKEIDVSLQVEAGRVKIPYQELLNIKTGDFLLLDTDLHLLNDENSRLLMTFQDRPLFTANLKDGSLKILEIPLYNEVQNPMQNKPQNPSLNPKKNTPMPKDPPPSEHEEEDLEHDPFFDEEEEEEEEEDYDDDFDLIEEPPIKAALKKELLKPEALQEKQPVPQEQKAQVESPKELEPISPENIPMTIVVEVCQISMSVQKLLELTPGNLLDLGIFPENNVRLSVNGKIIGKGEILKIGETLGVRILEIGT